MASISKEELIKVIANIPCDVFTFEHTLTAPMTSRELPDLRTGANYFPYGHEVRRRSLVEPAKFEFSVCGEVSEDVNFDENNAPEYISSVLKRDK